MTLKHHAGVCFNREYGTNQEIVIADKNRSHGKTESLVREINDVLRYLGINARSDYRCSR